MMTKFGERLKELALQLGKEDQDVAHELGLSKAQMSHYTTGKRKVPSELLQKIIDVYGINPQFLFDEKAPLYFENKKDINFIKENSEVYNISSDISSYPFYPISIAAGLPVCVDGIVEDDIEEIELPDIMMGKYANDEDIFVAEINGESMNKILANGSLIAIRFTPLECLKNGDIVVFSYDNDYSVKRFINDEENKRFIFRPESNDPVFTDYIVSYSDASLLTIHGKVVVYITVLD